MSYAVTWSAAAEAMLAEIWLAARDRSRIQEAADSVERLLHQQPTTFGESRTGMVRVAFARPLVIFFEIDEQNKIVSVVRVVRSGG